MWPLKLIVLEKWPKTWTLNLQLLHNTKRPTKWSGHMKMIDPQENFYIGATQCYQAFYLFYIPVSCFKIYTLCIYTLWVWHMAMALQVILVKILHLMALFVFISFLAHDRMSVASLCNHDLSVIVIIVIVVVCEHSSWPHAWPNKVHTLHAHAAISCIVAHQKLYHSDFYLLYSSHICMFILMSIVHEVINIATSNLTETRI